VHRTRFDSSGIEFDEHIANVIESIPPIASELGLRG